MKSAALPSFWAAYARLGEDIQGAHRFRAYKSCLWLLGILYRELATPSRITPKKGEDMRLLALFCHKHSALTADG